MNHGWYSDFNNNNRMPFEFNCVRAAALVTASGPIEVQDDEAYLIFALTRIVVTVQDFDKIIRSEGVFRRMETEISASPENPSEKHRDCEMP